MILLSDRHIDAPVVLQCFDLPRNTSLDLVCGVSSILRVFCKIDIYNDSLLGFNYCKKLNSLKHLVRTNVAESHN